MVNDFKTIELQGKIVFAKAVFSDFSRMTKYFFANESCFMFLNKGFFNLRTPDKIIGFQEGDSMLAKCGSYYVERPADANAPLEVIAVYFHPSIVKPFFPGDFSIAQFAPNYDVRNFPVNEMLKHFMNSIDFLLEHPEACMDELVVVKLKELLLLLSQTDNAASVYHFIHALFQPYEYDFREIILKNRDANLSVSELATLCNMSLATFKRRFSAVFSESPAQYLMKEKLKRASALLASPGEARISDIVYDCGFDTVSHFNKAFKRHFGQTPTDYRLSQKSKPMSL